MPQRHRLLVFRRLIAGECGLIAWEFDDDGARTGLALGRLVTAAARQKATAILPERRGIFGNVGLVALRIVYVRRRTQ